MRSLVVDPLHFFFVGTDATLPRVAFPRERRPQPLDVVRVSLQSWGLGRGFPSQRLRLGDEDPQPSFMSLLSVVFGATNSTAACQLLLLTKLVTLFSIVVLFIG